MKIQLRNLFKRQLLGFIKMKIVVTIPAYNEEGTIGQAIARIKKSLKGKYDYRVLVLDDGSSDKTANISKKNGAIVLSHPRNLGLAEAFRSEIEKSLEMGADIIV